MSESPHGEAEARRLLEQVQAGDRTAFELLFSRYRSELRRFVEVRLDARLRARVDASDVVQETQLEVFQRLADYLERQPMPFRLWLHKTAYERLLKARRRHLKTAQRAVDREVRMPDHSAAMLARQFCSAGSTPSQHLSRREMARLVTEALQELPETDSEVLLMRNIDGLAHEEIACLLGIDPATARKRYGRALLRLRRVLADRGLLESGT